MRTLIRLAVAALLTGVLALPAHAYIHPCIPHTTQDLDTIKANLDKEPWKSGYAQLLATWNPNYTPQPYETVTRNPNLNLTAWGKDMGAVWNYARLWYFTGNHAYAQKARDILIAWANTQTTMGGNEAGLALGDAAFAYGGGASILRGTWPGWTAADTAAVKNLFLNVYWPATANTTHLPGPANKGDINLSSGMAIALFCDDTAKFEHVLEMYRTYPGAGLSNTLPTGQMGESGRDAGHAYGSLLGKAFVAECLWKQGIDLYSEWDNRLLAVGEYYARNTLALDNPFVTYGTVDWLYLENAEGPYGANRAALYLLQNAYKNRKGLPTPWIDRKLAEQWVDNNNFMYARTADFSTATPPAEAVRPPVSLASNGLTLTTLGNNSAGRSSSYANGVWTITGAGADVWGDSNDDCQFAYKEMTGDCAIVARVTSVEAVNAATKAGVMLRDNLVGTVSQRAFAAMIPNTPNQYQSRVRGSTQNWAGRVAQTYTPPPGMPYWVKVERRSNHITTYSSQDGTSWSPTVSSYFGNLPSTLYVGLFIASGSATTPTTATFDHVAFTGGTGGLVTTPASPAAVLAAGSDKAITVRWLHSFGATAYDVLRSTTSGSGYTVIASDIPADKTSHMDTTAAAGTTYYYVVRAKNSAGTSGNSPEFYGSLLPAPMANLALGGTATDSAHSNGGEAANVFDGNAGSKWFNNNVGPTGWVQYDFGAGNEQLVKRYTVSSANDVPGRDPKDWTFLGSQDGTTWTTLDSQSGQTFANRYQQNTYPIGNTTAYRYYRLNITANGGDAAVQLSELGLWGDTGRTVPDGTYVLASRHSNKVIDLVNGGTADGTDAMQWGWNGGDDQKWNFTYLGNGQYKLTGVASGKLLEVAGASGSNGAPVQIWPSNNHNCQKWTVTPAGDGFFKLLNVNSGKSLDVQNSSTANGANIVQFTANDANSQQWRVGVSTAPQPMPPTPTGLAGSALSIHQINLTWMASPGAISYNIKRSTTSGGPYTTISDPVNTTSFTDSGLNSSTTYYYVVSALNGSGESANSPEASSTTLTAPPDAPANLTTILGTDRVTLSWAASGGATSYSVKRATTSGGPYTTVIEGLTGTTFADTSISHDTTYYYRVVANNADGTGPDSAEVIVGAGTLVTHLKFDEAGGDIAHDSSGRGLHATFESGAGITAGILEGGLNLPATSSQHAQLPSGIASGLTDFTVTTWIKVNAFATWQRIFDFGTGGNNNMFLTAQGPVGAGRLRFSIRTPSVAEQKLDSTVALTAGAWTHVAVVRSGNTVSIYINGTLAGSGTTTLSPADLGFTTRNYLGKSQFADPYLNATLDDFRLYSNALSPAELAAMANPAAGAPTRLTAAPGNTQAILSWFPNATTTYTVKRAATSGGPFTTIAEGVTSLTYTDTGLTNGSTYYYIVSGSNGGGSGPDSAEVAVTPTPLGLHLKFDESTGTVATDSSVRALHATLVNDPAFTTGKVNNGLNLTATSSQHATLPSGIVNGLSDFTISTWVKVNAFATWQRIFDFGTGTNNYMFLTTQYTPTAPNNAKLRFNIRTPSIAEQTVSGTGIALTVGTWNHVAVVRSGNTVSLYVNGSLSGSGTITINPVDLGATTLNYLGKSQWGNDPYLNGALDDFRLYSRAFSSSEVTSLATVPLAPTSLTATAGSGQVTLNWGAVSGVGDYTVKRATTSGGPYETIQTDIASISFTDTGLNSGTTYYYVVSASNTTNESSNSAEISAITIPAAPTGLTTSPGNGQVALSWNASTGAASYTVLRATSPGGPYATLASGLTGTSYADTTALPGWTYYYAISAGNGSGQSQSSASATITTATVALSWLKLDETAGTSAVDAIGNNTGTLVNAPAWTAGRIGNALGLNGTNQYATLPNGVASNLHDFTVSTWVYWNGGGNWQRVFDFGNGTSTYMFLTPKNSAGKLRFSITTSGSAGEQKIDGNAALPSGAWCHVAVTLSGSTGTLYVNGQQVGQNTALTLRPCDLGVTTQNRIGRSQYNDPYFNGRLDDFRLYAGALSPTKIAALATPMQATGLTATGGNAQISLAWSQTPGANHYSVHRASTSGGAFTTIASSITATSYQDLSAINGTTYYYIVTPINASGDGANSNETSGLALSPQQQWRLTHFGNFANNGTAADAADPDGDGWTNAAEFASGTNPNDRASVLRLTSMLASGNDMRLSFPTVSGKIYRLERSATLEDDSWTTVGGNITGTGSAIQITDAGGANQSKRFYRIVVVP